MEIGITGGEEDGVDNSDVAPEDLYSKPEEIYQVYQAGVVPRTAPRTGVESINNPNRTVCKAGRG